MQARSATGRPRTARSDANFTFALPGVTIGRMGARSAFVRRLAVLATVAVAALGLAATLPGCVDTLPEKIVLNPGADNVEVINEPPNREVYESAGEVTAQVVGRETQDALRQALNQLRNKAAAKGATFIAVDDVSSRAAWDFSGRTIVTLVGTAYRPR